MKDLLKKIIISVVSWWFIGYLAYLFFQNTVIVQWWFSEYNMIYYIILFVICLFLFVFFGIYPIHFKITKATLFVIGIALIVIWDTVLINDISNHVYVSDIFKVLWVILTLLAWTNVLITDKVKKQKQNKKVKVIEV
jgi:hypothetical protein